MPLSAVVAAITLDATSAAVSHVQWRPTMQPQTVTIHIHPQAPAKPALGSTCNGCGVCCLVAPCPVGMVLSRKRQGVCDAVRWNDAESRYRCGAIDAPHDVLLQALPRWAGVLARPLAPALRRWALRWIAVGIGCDSNVEPVRSLSTPFNPFPRR